MSAATKMQTLSGDELQELLALLKGADTVELKLTIPESQRNASLVALGIDPLDARIRQVFFFDTPELALDRAGLVVRARRVQGAAADSVVKRRPVVPDELSSKTRRDPFFGVEVPVASPSVPNEVLDPRSAWADKAEHDAQARKLAGMFAENFKEFECQVPPEVTIAGPHSN